MRRYSVGVPAIRGRTAGAALVISASWWRAVQRDPWSLQYRVEFVLVFAAPDAGHLGDAVRVLFEDEACMVAGVGADEPSTVELAALAPRRPVSR